MRIHFIVHGDRFDCFALAAQAIGAEVFLRNALFAQTGDAILLGANAHLAQFDANEESLKQKDGNGENGDDRYANQEVSFLLQRI